MATTVQQKFWQTLARGLQMTKDPLATLKQMVPYVQGDQLEQVTSSIIHEIQAGKNLSAAMRGFPDLFGAKIVAAVEAGEEAGNLEEVAARIAAALEKGDLDNLPAPQPGDSEGSANAEAARLVNEIILQGVRSQATEIAMEVLERGRLRIRQRIDFVLHEMRTLPDGSARPIIDRLKAMANLNLTESRLPQDARIMMQLDGEDIDVRISTLPTFYGERVCMRLLRRQEVLLGLDKLGLTGENLATIRQFCGLASGIVIVNGPTGSGKTTLLYSMIREMDQTGQAILTVEDPVELSFEKISQTQIQPEIGLTFGRAIRSMLRQGCDVMMIGELRDREMVELSVQVAMTGHLVLTTLHARTSSGAIRRLLDIGLPPFMLNAALSAVVSQMLIRQLCPQCKQAIQIDTALLSGEAAKAIVRHKGATWYGPTGCAHCSQTGYHGMAAVHEILVMNDALRQAVTTDSTAGQLREVAIRAGMKTMLEDGLAKAAGGITSIEEVLRVVPQDTHR